MQVKRTADQVAIIGQRFRCWYVLALLRQHIIGFLLQIGFNKGHPPWPDVCFETRWKFQRSISFVEFWEGWSYFWFREGVCKKIYIK